MDSLDILMEEHRLIERVMKILTVAAEQIEVDYETFEKIIDFIRNYADKFHHAKEEGELFPLIENKGIPKNGGPIGMMLHEHDQGRNYVKSMEDSLIKYKEGDKSQSNVISRNALDFVDLLEAHIRKEDNILYPMSSRVLSNQDKISLAQRFKDIETKEWVGITEKYQKTVNDLEKKFNI